MDKHLYYEVLLNIIKSNKEIAWEDVTIFIPMLLALFRNKFIDRSCDVLSADLGVGHPELMFWKHRSQLADITAQ